MTLVAIILGVILVGVGLFFLISSFVRARSDEGPILFRVDGLALEGLNVGLLLTIFGTVVVLAPTFLPILDDGRDTSPPQATSPPTATASTTPPTATATTTSPPIVDIASLRDGQSVPTVVNGVRGTSKNLRSGQEIWLVIIVQGIARFYPQNGPVSVQPDGDWTSPPVIFGGDQDVGRRFDLLAVLAAPTAGKAFTRYLEEGERTKSFPGIKTLPRGAVEYDRVTVVRR